jgi:pyruvate,water dikinase
MAKILFFSDCSYKNKNIIGGKNASLGELVTLSQKIGFNISNGFAITTNMYDDYLLQNNILENIEAKLEEINVGDIRELTYKSKIMRDTIINGEFTIEQFNLIKESYQKLKNMYNEDISVAVRSSAIAEDMPNASFAGQQDTFLNIKSLDDLLISIKKCFASLFNARAISYRHSNNIHHSLVKISIGIQKMIRSDIGSAGVAFSLDTESGYKKAIIINSSFGLGEGVVSGLVNPDEIIVDKRVLSIDNSDPIIMKKIGSKLHKIIYSDTSGTIEVETTNDERNNISLNNSQSQKLAKTILSLEKNYEKLLGYQCAIDIEWALDGVDNKLYILQTRPETVHSNNNSLCIENYILEEESNIIISGVAVGKKISSGTINVIDSMENYHLFNDGDILVTDMTTPDWEPIMKKASGIITNKGGRTCHAAIVARELGLNAIVGVGNAIEKLKTNDSVTMCCSRGETGYVYDKILNYSIDKISFDSSKKLPIKMMMNVGNPECSFHSSMIPNDGVGLARLEFIITNHIKIHPLALLNHPNLNTTLKNKIDAIIGKQSGEDFFVDKLARGMSKIASAFYPEPVIVRLSDFKSNEYKNLLGGVEYEPNEENPMIGWRGASRYYHQKYIRAFELECKAIKYARNIMKMTNIIVMIPFCRTPEECEKVISTMAKFGLIRGDNGLQIYLMCEIPSNVIEADNFSQYIDGVSIGGNDLLQLTLGIDRDSEMIKELSDHTNISYRRMIKMAIETYKKYDVKVGFCGQQPSDSVEFAKFLIDSGIDSISVVPESALQTITTLG